MAAILVEFQLDTEGVAALKRSIGIMDYRTGWYMVANNKPYSECTSDAMRDGWIASYDADPALRRTGIQQPATGDKEQR